MTHEDWRSPNLWEAERIRSAALALARRRLREGADEATVRSEVVRLLEDEARATHVVAGMLEGGTDIEGLVEMAYKAAALPPSLSLGRPSETRRPETLSRLEGWDASVAVRDAAWKVARQLLRERHVVVMRTLSQPIDEAVARMLAERELVPAMRDAVGAAAIAEWAEHDAVTEGLLWPDGVMDPKATVPSVFDATLRSALAVMRQATHAASDRELPSAVRETLVSSSQASLDALTPALAAVCGCHGRELEERLRLALSANRRLTRELEDGLSVLSIG